MSTPGQGGYIETVNDIYNIAYTVGQTIEIKSISNFTTLNNAHSTMSYGPSTITITKPNGETVEFVNSSGTFKFDISGSYIIKYSGYNVGESLSGNIYTANYTFAYKIIAIENHLPLKKWTITDVINRTLDLAEPLRKGERSRFRLNGMTADGKIIAEGDEGAGQAAQLDKILAPEMSFTKQTLRECLQDVGGFIHGEPRLTPKKDADGWYYEVIFDMYASQDKSDIYTMPYIKNTVSQIIDSYTSYLDSNAENLVNQLDKYSGVIIEPYADGAKTLRTENMYVRIEDGNAVIATQYPIYSVDKLEYVYKDGNELKSLDITPWLFEKSVYDTQLKSYEEQYPYSKAYGIYYTQGSKNISGLFFKVDSAVLAAFKEYAIVNIINQASNGKANIPNSKNYPEMSFRVTYTPFYNARVGQTKPYYKDFIRPAALIYNQQSNVIESRYYGENLKGAVARLGTVEKSKTYLLAQLYEIPKAGQMFDKDYYISAVSVEFLPTIIKCTIGLSKDFNRLSRYIGISSVKRYSEISQTQAVERNTLYKEYIVIGEKEQPDYDTVMNDSFLLWVGQTFFQSGESGSGRITNVAAWGTTYQGNSAGGAVNLPVISSAFGNSVSFSWKYEDNYSAGATSEYVENAFKNNVSGYFQNSYSYTDYYGRIYYYDFVLQDSGPKLTVDNFPKQGEDLPAGNAVTDTLAGPISTVGKQPYVLRKDNREALQVNFQIDFVTNLENLIIGSALASYNPAVRGTDAKLAEARLYVFPTELNKFTDHVEAFEDVNLSELPSAALKSVDDGGDGIGYGILGADNFPASGKSWAIVTPQYTKTETVVDETGKQYEQTQYFGGDLLIGQNIEVTAGQAFTPVYFTKKREIFDKTVWKEKR